ncbi:MAG TPA: hypothetical protein PKC29_01515 [Thermodesulfobacteriota bacterium]|nr:hypothetical protein [Thermodesulfobacteriota bacterium]
MKTPSANDNSASPIARQSVLVLLSAGALIICGSYVLDGFGENSGSAREPHSVSHHLNSRAGQYAASTDTGDEDGGGYGAGCQLARLSDSAAGYVFAGSLSPYWYSVQIPVNPFKYESHFGFSPLRSPPHLS